MSGRKTYTGEVISDKMNKTVVVRVSTSSKHSKYNRIMRQHNKFKVHDEKGSAKVGDIVNIEETRPISKEKRFRLIGVIKRSAAPEIELKE